MWIVRRTLPYNLVAIMKTTTPLEVSSSSIITPQIICFLLLYTEMKTWCNSVLE